MLLDFNGSIRWCENMILQFTFFLNFKVLKQIQSSPTPLLLIYYFPLPVFYMTPYASIYSNYVQLPT